MIYLQLLWVFIKIGLLGFGGGRVLSAQLAAGSQTLEWKLEG